MLISGAAKGRGGGLSRLVEKSTIRRPGHPPRGRTFDARRGRRRPASRACRAAMPAGRARRWGAACGGGVVAASVVVVAAAAVVVAAVAVAVAFACAAAAGKH